MILSALATGFPQLPFALCRGEWQLIDRTTEGDPAAIAAALDLCRACPELQPCADWLDGLLPRDRPDGVCAGRTKKRRKEYAA